MYKETIEDKLTFNHLPSQFIDPQFMMHFPNKTLYIHDATVRSSNTLYRYQFALRHFGCTSLRIGSATS